MEMELSAPHLETTYHVSRTPRDAHGTRKSRGTWNKTGCPQDRTEHDVRKLTPPDTTALVPLPSPTPPDPRPGLNLPTGPGGPGGPAGPCGQWLLVSVKVLDSSGSPGEGTMMSEQGWASLGGAQQPVSPGASAKPALTALWDGLQRGWGHGGPASGWAVGRVLALWDQEAGRPGF